MTIDSAEFEQFVAARWPALFRTAYLLTGDAGTAEDLTQSALANTFARRSRIRDAHALEAYVRRAQTNLVISASRRPGFHRERLTDQPPETGGGDEITAAGERLDLRAVLERLSPRQRVVVVLRFYDDLAVSDVAAAIGSSEGNVKRITHEALQRLRTLVPFDADSDLLSEGSPR